MLLVLALPARGADAAGAPVVAPPPGEPEHPPAEHSPEPLPMTAEARAHYEQGLRLYGDHDFTAAIREFEAGFTLEPRREFLFAEAQAYRLAGDCVHAVPLYERFLGSGPSPLQVDATRLALDRCARQPPPVVTRAAPPVVTSLPLAAIPPQPSTERAPWWHDRWGLGAMGAGVAAAGVGLGFVIASRSAADQANGPAIRYPDYARLWNTAERRQTIGVVSLAAGGALLAAGTLRLLWVRHQAAPAARSPQAPSLAAIVAPLPGGAGLLSEFSF